MINLGHGYYVQIRGYNAQEKDLMNIIRFKQIRSDFHPEPGTSFYGDKCHQHELFYPHVK